MKSWPTLNNKIFPKLIIFYIKFFTYKFDQNLCKELDQNDNALSFLSCRPYFKFWFTFAFLRFLPSMENEPEEIERYEDEGNGFGFEIHWRNV